MSKSKGFRYNTAGDVYRFLPDQDPTLTFTPVPLPVKDQAIEWQNKSMKTSEPALDGAVLQINKVE